MINYNFECTVCDYQWEICQSIKDKFPTHCPSCGLESAKCVIQPFAMSIKGMETIGQLMDRNTSRMGTYEKQEKAPKKIKREGKFATTDIPDSPVTPRNVGKIDTQRYIETGRVVLK